MIINKGSYSLNFIYGKIFYESAKNQTIYLNYPEKFIPFVLRDYKIFGTYSNALAIFDINDEKLILFDLKNPIKNFLHISHFKYGNVLIVLDENMKIIILEEN